MPQRDADRDENSAHSTQTAPQGARCNLIGACTVCLDRFVCKVLIGAQIIF